MMSQLLLSLLLGTAEPGVAGQPVNQSARDQSNWDVLLSQYPPRALAAGEQGQVGFKVSLDREGYASSCEVTRSSGYQSLDQETCRLILSHATFKGIKTERGRKVNSTHEGVINWKLPPGRGGAPGLSAPVPVSQSVAPEKMICKRRLRTGSLADFERLCYTKSDWQRMAHRNQEAWEEVQGKKASTYGN